jgi:F0F1-type ATP synthase assembly protein I
VDAAHALPSYRRSAGQTLFGGDSVADDLARRGDGRLDDLEFGDDLEHDDEDDDDLEVDDESTMSSFARGALVVGQCVLAVLFGAGLFIAFDQLWKWNNIVALVLSVLVILGLVVGVRVVRKTEDIGSTLIAVAVGALVTLGPLALLQSG